MHWRLVLSPPMRGIANMSLDEALLERARSFDEGVVRVYSWSVPTLSFGRHQTARGAYDPLLATARGVDIVRRPTGGRALLHHREITYSVTAPIVPGQSLRYAYETINALLIDALGLMGVDAVAATITSRTPHPGIAPCFEEPSRGELTLAGRKLVGSAQYREKNSYLQHGSVLVDDDQGTLAQLSRVPLGDIPRAATLRDAVGETSPEHFADALFDIVRRRWDSSASPLAPNDTAFDRAQQLLAHYADDAWTWRR